MTRPEEYYRTGFNYEPDHRTYGGKIIFSDFNTQYPGKSNYGGSSIAKRIEEDRCFDQYCKKCAESRAREKAYLGGLK